MHGRARHVRRNAAARVVGVRVSSHASSSVVDRLAPSAQWTRIFPPRRFAWQDEDQPQQQQHGRDGEGSTALGNQGLLTAACAKCDLGMRLGGMDCETYLVDES
jgi:hypothetical protein